MPDEPVNGGNLYQAPRRRRSREEIDAEKLEQSRRRAERTAKRSAVAVSRLLDCQRAARAAANAAESVPAAERRLEAAITAGEAARARVEASNRREAARRKADAERYGSKNEGTPETHGHAGRTKQSALSRMVRLGKATPDDLAAAHEIAEVIEMIESGVAMRTAQLERVDNMGAGRDALVEGLKRVRLEVAYTLWRDGLPAPKRMILDMIVSSGGYVSIAKAHGVHWRTARKRLLRELGRWPGFVAEARRTVSREDLNYAHAALGEGDGL